MEGRQAIIVETGEEADALDAIVAAREYEVILGDGRTGNVAFTLGDLGHDSVPASFARAAGALAYGLILIEGLIDAPDHPLVWMQRGSELTITVADGDRRMAPHAKAVVAPLFARFIDEVKAVAPSLGVVEFRPASAPRNSLH